MAGVVQISFLIAILVFTVHEIPGSYLEALKRSYSETGLSSNTPKLRRINTYQPGTRIGRKGCRIDYKLDYLMLTLEWGPGVCATSPRVCQRKENRLFTVHGMWPQLYNSDSPAFCCFDNTFDYKLIEPLVPALEKYWFSYYDQESRGFWSHEWLRHGTCARDVKQLQGEKMFFGTVIDIVKQLPVLETLVKAGIVPGNNSVYNSVQIQNVLRRMTGGKNVRINCDLEAHQPIALLTGLSLCFDVNLKFIDCPPKGTRCLRQLYFLK